MPAKNQTLTVYPAPRSVAIVGGNSPACNAAIECWSEMLRRHVPVLDRDEWSLLAEMLNSTITDASWTADHLSAEINDAHRLDGAGQKWLAKGRAAADLAVARLVADVRAWDWPTVQHALVAVRWFWSNHDSVSLGRDEWWTVEFRCAR